MSYTVHHLLGHVHGVYDTPGEVLNAVLTLIPIGNTKQRKLTYALSSMVSGRYTQAEHETACVLIYKN